MDVLKTSDGRKSTVGSLKPDSLSFSFADNAKKKVSAICTVTVTGWLMRRERLRSARIVSLLQSTQP